MHSSYLHNHHMYVQGLMKNNTNTKHLIFLSLVLTLYNKSQKSFNPKCNILNQNLSTQCKRNHNCNCEFFIAHSHRAPNVLKWKLNVHKLTVWQEVQRVACWWSCNDSITLLLSRIKTMTTIMSYKISIYGMTSLTTECIVQPDILTEEKTEIYWQKNYWTYLTCCERGGMAGCVTAMPDDIMTWSSETFQCRSVTKSLQTMAIKHLD